MRTNQLILNFKKSYISFKYGIYHLVKSKFCISNHKKIILNKEQIHIIERFQDQINQGKFEECIKECQHYIEKSKQKNWTHLDNEIILYYHSLGAAFYHKQDYLKSLEYSLITKEIITKHDSQFEPLLERINLQVTKQISKCYYELKQFAKSNEYGLDAIKLAKYLKDDPLEAKLCLLVADNYQEIEDLEQSYNYMKKAKELFVKANLVSNIIDLAIIYLKIAMKKNKISKEFSDKLVLLVEEMNFFIDKCDNYLIKYDFYNTLACYYLEEKEITKAEEFNIICLEIVKQQVLKTPQDGEIDDKVIKVLEELAEINVKLGKLVDAESLLEELLLKRKNLAKIGHLHKDINMILRCYIKNNNISKFSSFFKNNLLFCYKNKLINDKQIKEIFDNFQMLVLVLVDENKFEEALQTLELYKNSVDLFLNNNNKKIAIEYYFTAARFYHGKDASQKSIDYIFKENILQFILDVEGLTASNGVSVNLMRYYALLAENHYKIYRENNENQLACNNCIINSRKAIDIALHYKDSAIAQKILNEVEQYLNELK